MHIQIVHTKNLRWIDIVNPETEDIKWLRNNFNFLELHFQAVAEQQQRPHIDHGEGYDFLVLLFPVYNRATQEIVPGEVDFFVGEGFLITVHYGQIHSHKNLFEQTKKNTKAREEYMQKGSGFLLYKVLESLFRRSYPILDHMSEDINEIEQKIFHEQELDMLSKIMLMKKNIIEFRKMMKTHKSVLEKLPRRKVPYLNFSQSKIYYRDLSEYSQNIWDVLEALKETADTLHETSGSLATRRLNEMTRRISIFSTILLPATLVAFLFGIGVEFIPLRYHPFGFWIIAGLMTLASLLLFLIFKNKRWF